MADAKISALTNLTAADAINDMIPIVDVSDTPPASGNTKRISINNILSSSPTASGALTVTGLVTAGSATITGAATVGTTLGVTGVSTFAAGTALLPALTTTGDVNTGIYYPAADTFAVTTAGVERYRVDSSGNLGVGVTPSTWGGASKAIEIGTYSAFSGNTSTAGAYVSNNACLSTNNDATGWVYKATDSGATLYRQQLGTHRWSYAGAGTAGGAVTFTSAMTLDASGNLMVGTTSSIARCSISYLYPNTGIGLTTDSNSTQTAIQFNTLAGVAGSINTNALTTTYNTASDYRLKESVAPLNGGLSRVNALKPSVYTWKVNGSAGEGFLAHELAEVVPSAVSGDKDAVDADGKPTYQGVDLSKLVPILVAAIQELTARVQTLEAR